MRLEKVVFANAAGEKIAGRLDLPAAEPAAYALFAHCFTCTKNIRAAAYIAGAMAEKGIGVLRFDFTGLGESGGEFADTNFSSNVADYLAAADFMAANYAPPAILIGHSLGGTVMLRAAASVPSAKAVATIASPCDPSHVAHMFAHARDTIENEGKAEVEIAGRRFTIKRQLLDDLGMHNMHQAIAGLRKALMVFHAPLDAVVGVENAALIFQAAKHPKSFISLDDADHMLSHSADAKYVGEVIAAWASRYL